MKKDQVSLKSLRQQGIKVNDNLYHVGYQPAMLPVVLVFLAVCTFVVCFFASDYLLVTMMDSDETRGYLVSKYKVSSYVCRGGSSRTGGTDACRDEIKYQVYYTYMVGSSSYNGSAFLEDPSADITVVYKKSNPELHYVKGIQSAEGIWGFIVILVMLYVIFIAGYMKRVLNHLCGGERILRNGRPQELITVDEGGNIAALLKVTKVNGTEEWFLADRRKFSEDDCWDVVWSRDHSSYDVYCHPNFHM
jgi:hypothetical protein